MRDIEGSAVRAVQRLLDSCSQLRGEIKEGDRTPITDGFIDRYRVPGSSKRSDIVGRVAVQVKGKSHLNKKKFAAKSIPYQIETEVLQFFRDNGGGVYFCVLIHPETGQERVFARTLIPYALNRMINKMSPGQQSLSVKLDVCEDPSRLDRMVAFAFETSKQDVRQGFDPSLLHGDAEIELMSIDGLDLSRPATLSLDTQDFAVIVRSGDLRVHADIDLSIVPANYVEHEAGFVVSCGDVRYDTVYVRKVDDTTGQIRLGKSITLTIEDTGKRLSSELNLATGDTLPELIKAMRFFTALANREELWIGTESLRPKSAESSFLDGLSDLLGRYTALAELFALLEVDAHLIDPTEITPAQMNTLGLAYRAIVRGEELSSSSGNAGRFDVHIGDDKIILIAIPAATAGKWVFFDPFDPGNRSRYRLYAVDDDPTVREIFGTAYEVVIDPEISHVLNLRLHHLVSSYDGLTDVDTARALANRKVLHLIGGADATDLAPRRVALLEGAQALNDWLLTGNEDPIHRVNRWQINHRLGALDDGQRNQIRSLRREVIRSDARNATQLEACCAILLGDPEDIRDTLRTLTTAEAEELRGWPIWNLTTADED